MSLREMFRRIEAFKEDMEDLGVCMSSSVHSMPVGLDHEVGIHLRILVREDLEARPCKHGPIPRGGCPKDLEASG